MSEQPLSNDSANESADQSNDVPNDGALTEQAEVFVPGDSAGDMPSTEAGAGADSSEEMGLGGSEDARPGYLEPESPEGVTSPTAQAGEDAATQDAATQEAAAEGEPGGGGPGRGVHARDARGSR